MSTTLLNRLAVEANGLTGFPIELLVRRIHLRQRPFLNQVLVFTYFDVDTGKEYWFSRSLSADNETPVVELSHTFESKAKDDEVEIAVASEFVSTVPPLKILYSKGFRYLRVDCCIGTWQAYRLEDIKLMPSFLRQSFYDSLMPKDPDSSGDLVLGDVDLGSRYDDDGESFTLNAQVLFNLKTNELLVRMGYPYQEKDNTTIVVASIDGCPSISLSADGDPIGSFARTKDGGSCLEIERKNEILTSVSIR